MAKLTEVLGLDQLPNYLDRRYSKNMEKLSKPVYEVELHEDVWMTLRDGVRLCVDVYLPKGAGKVPALLLWSAYSKKMQYIKRGGIPPESLVFDHSLEAGDVDFFVKRGYAYIIPDPRGIGKSEGDWWGVYNPMENRDIYDVIEWIASQDWCDSNVAMTGYSYFGICEMVAASFQPPHLKCIMPYGFVDDYYQHGYYGGVPATYMSMYWELCPSSSAKPWSLKLYGEEKMKKMMEERQKDPDIGLNSYFSKILNTWPPNYHTFYLDYLLNPLDNEYWKGRSANQVYEKVKIPVYMTSSWSPLGRWSAPIFNAMEDERLSCVKRMGILAGYDALELPNKDIDLEVIRWCDYWLKGLDTGIMDEPLYKFSVLNSGMRYENEWPLKRTDWKKLYLRTFGRLKWSKEDDKNLPPDGFVHNPPTICNKIDSLTYRTSRLTSPLEVTGPIELHLFLSIDAEDANILVGLKDIMPDGTEHPLYRYGALRASHPLDKEKSKIGRPVHDNSVSIPVTPGEIREYVIEINPTSIMFLPGHCIELEIKSMNFEKCQSQTWTGKVQNMNAIPSNRTICYKVYRDNEYQSYILLPVIHDTPEENWMQPLEDYEVEE